MLERPPSTVSSEEMTAAGLSRRDFLARATAAAAGGPALAHTAPARAASVQRDGSPLPP